MAEKLPCPECGKKSEIKALVDSEQRIWQHWRYCPWCGWDQRHTKQGQDDERTAGLMR